MKNILKYVSAASNGGADLYAPCGVDLGEGGGSTQHSVAQYNSMPWPKPWCQKCKAHLKISLKIVSSLFCISM